MGVHQPTMESMAIKRILVTGSEGYIGAVLVPLLCRVGYAVCGLDTCFYGISGNSGYTLVRKDIRDITKKDIAGIDAVIHLAALSNDPMGDLDEKLTEDINFRSSVNLARLAKASGVSRFLFSSSCSIYGKKDKDLVDESSPVVPLTAYAKSKIRTEQELQKLAEKNFTVGILRNSTVYGFSPMFRSDLVVNNFVIDALMRSEIRIKSDGTPWRPLIDVRDLSSVFLEFLTAPKEAINGRITNIGFVENNLQVRDVLDTVKNVLPRCNVIYTGEHGKDTRSYRVDFGRLTKLFPQVRQEWPLQKSIADMVSHLTRLLRRDTSLRDEQFVRLKMLTMLRSVGTLDANLRWC